MENIDRKYATALRPATSLMLNKLGHDPLSKNTTEDYDRLKHEDVCTLLNMPIYVSSELMNVFEDINPHDLLRSCEYRSMDDDLSSTIDILREIFVKLLLITSPDSPAFLGSLAPLSLFVANINYFMLVEVLSNHLVKGVYNYGVIIPPEISLNGIPKALHFPCILNEHWLRWSIDAIYHNLHNGMELVDTTNDERDIKFYEIRSLYLLPPPKAGTPVTDATIREMLRLEHLGRIDLHIPNQTTYELSLLHQKDHPTKIAFIYKGGIDSNAFRRIVLKYLMHIENGIIKELSIIKMHWQWFIASMHNVASRDSKCVSQWMNTIMRNSNLLYKSFEYPELVNALLSLGIRVPTNADIARECDAYTRQFRKYIPAKIRIVIKLACVEINEVMNHTKKFARYDKKDKALAYMRDNADRFKIITPDQIGYAIGTYYNYSSTKQDVVGNEMRDIREYIAQDVAKKLGLDISKAQIRDLFKSMKSTV